jgi:hypothetical protein
MSPRFAVLFLSSAVLAPAVAMAQGRLGHPALPQLHPVTVSGSGASCSDDGLCLAVTVALADPADPQACAGTTSIVADVGEQISWCYTLTNNGTQSFAWQTLTDSLHGTLFSELRQDLAPGQSYQYVKLEVVGDVVDADVSATWTASTARPSYTFDDTVAYDFIDASDGTLLEQTGGFPHGRTVPVQAPFALDFFGSVTDRLCIGANGAIQVGTELCAIPSTLAFPSTYLDAAIAPAWSSYSDSIGEIYTKTLGEPGQRRFVVEWKDMQLDWPTMPGFTFEVVADEASGSYLFQYQSTGDGSGSFGDAGEQAVSGMQADTTTAVPYSHFTPTLTPGKAVLWSLQQSGDAFSTSADVHVDIGAPKLALPVAELDAHAATAIRVTQPLVIGNDGNRVLDWNAGEYPALRLPPIAPRAMESTAAGDTAAPAARHAPQIATADAGSSKAPASILGDLGVPAFAVQLDTGTGGQDFIGFDLLTPTVDDASIIIPNIDQAGMDIAAGDFVDNDFSREWVLDYYRNQLSTLDTTTGARTLVGWTVPQNVVANEQWWGASWDPASGNFYAVSNGSNGWSGLYSIDLDTAAATFIGKVDSGLPTSVVADIAVDQGGQMYGLDTLNDVLIAIDKSSGAATVVGSLGVDAQFAQSIKFDRSTGTLYWTSYDATGAAAVATIDPVTGVPTPVAPSGDHRQLFALAIAKAGGDCTQPLDASWLTVETPSGTAQPGDPYGVYNVDFDATALPAGDYEATICVFSNDPGYRTHPAVVPVHFNVAPESDDTIFGDGFDG